MALFFNVPKIASILHSAQDPDWYTEPKYIHAAREVMGGIDLDPASEAEANKVIQATTYYTKEQNGLLLPWKGRIFLNPPGGLVVEFWEKLMFSLAEPTMDESKVTEFIWIGYSLEQLQTLQVCPRVPQDFSICTPKKRIAFVENDAKRALRVQKCLKDGKAFKEKTSPSHANYIVYSGPNIAMFKAVFQKFGHVRL